MRDVRKEPRLEGFWHSEGEPWFPKPEAHTDEMPRKSLFLDMLSKAEAKSKEDGQTQHYRGFSRCRICGIINGSTEHRTKGWKWPEGYRHYLDVHNVRPSLAFQMAIMGTHFKWELPNEEDVMLRKGVDNVRMSEDEKWLIAAIAASRNP